VSESLKEASVRLAGKKVCIVANASIFKDNLALFLEKGGAKTMVSGLEDKTLEKKTSQADVIITAVGKPGYLKGGIIKKDSVIVDLGITKQDGKVLGDVDAGSVKEKASYLTPVPGGTGPITVAATLKSTLELYKRKNKKKQN
jgi:methylenetetrahydrofolate dehydrogenase (NADP+)/methenyltetrahydrofolate cyclohydrolase